MRVTDADAPLPARASRRDLVAFISIDAAVGVIAGTFALIGQASPRVVELSTPGGIALSIVAGLVMGAVVGRNWSSAIVCGAMGGFTNAAVGIATAMAVRDVDPLVLAAGSAGGVALGALAGALAFAVKQRVSRPPHS